MADPVTITTSGATLVLIAERLFSYFISPRMRTSSEEATRRATSSGELDPAYWKKEFREAIIETNQLQIVPLIEKLIDAHAQVVELLHERSTIFQRQTDLLAELVDVGRESRRRR